MNCHHVFKLNHMQNVAQTAQNLSIIIYLSETSSGCDICDDDGGGRSY